MTSTGGFAYDQISSLVASIASNLFPSGEGYVKSLDNGLKGGVYPQPIPLKELLCYRFFRVFNVFQGR